MLIDCNNNEEEVRASSPSAPTSLVVKTYGGNIFTKQAAELSSINSCLVQSIIFHEQSTRGWGPKLYGLFDGGRIEEFIDCHTLTAQEAFSDQLMADVATAYARFHSLKLPIKQHNYDFLGELLISAVGARTQLKHFLDSQDIPQSEPLKRFKKLHDFPLEEESHWVNRIRAQVKQRTVLCTLDPNYLNRLVRSERAKDPGVTRTIIIDFDLTAYSDRGFDLGGHFVLRVFDWSRKDTYLTGLPYPSEGERAAFLSAYLEESCKLLDDFDATSLDSLTNLMLEADLNAFVFIISIIIFGFKLYSVLDQVPHITSHIDHMLQLYADLKLQFFSKYPHLR